MAENGKPRQAISIIDGAAIRHNNQDLRKGLIEYALSLIDGNINKKQRAELRLKQGAMINMFVQAANRLCIKTFDDLYRLNEQPTVSDIQFLETYRTIISEIILAQEAIVSAMAWHGSARSAPRKAANVRHDKIGGSREKQEQIRTIWSTGKYSDRNTCADQERDALGMSWDTARKALRNTPDPLLWTAKKRK